MLGKKNREFDTFNEMNWYFKNYYLPFHHGLNLMFTLDLCTWVVAAAVRLSKGDKWVWANLS